MVFFSILVWHLLSDLDAATSELSRVLGSGGKFQIITANPDSYKTWKNFYKDFKLDGNRLDGTMELSDGMKSTDTLFLHTSEEIQNSMQKFSLVVDQMDVICRWQIGKYMKLFGLREGKVSYHYFGMTNQGNQMNYFIFIFLFLSTFTGHTKEVRNLKLPWFPLQKQCGNVNVRRTFSPGLFSI